MIKRSVFMFRSFFVQRFGGKRLDVQTAAESSGGVVRLGAVVIEEDVIVAPIAEDGAAEFSDLSRRLHPARRLQIELSEQLQVAILIFGQEFDADRRCHIDGAVFWFVLFPGGQRLTIVTETATAVWTFGGTVEEEIFARLFIKPDDIGFAACLFHFIERPQFFWV